MVESTAHDNGLIERLSKPIIERLPEIVVGLNIGHYQSFTDIEADMKAAADKIAELESKLAFLSQATGQSLHLVQQAKDALQTCIFSMEGDCSDHHKIALNTADQAFRKLTKVAALPTSAEATSLLTIAEQQRWSIMPQCNGGWVIETADDYGDDGQEREIVRTRGSLTAALMEAVCEELPKEFEWLLMASRNRELLHVPSGWKAMPAKLTQAMEDAAYEAAEAYEKAETGAWCGLSSTYDAMVAKAPSPSSRLFPGTRIQTSPEKKTWDAERYFAEMRCLAWDTYEDVVFDLESVKPSIGQYQAMNTRHLKRIYAEARASFPEYADTLMWILRWKGIDANRHETLSESFGVGRYIPKDDENLWSYWRDKAYLLQWSTVRLKSTLRDVVSQAVENAGASEKSVVLPASVLESVSAALAEDREQLSDIGGAS
jgi:hypothetical protein